MPILEFECEECSHHFETIVQGSRQARCPACASQALKRVLSVFAVGGQSDRFAASEPIGACGTCGDPRGAGACSLS